MSRVWRVEVDQHKCIGSGMCVASAPEQFRLAGRRAESLREDGVDPDEAVLDAAESCPAEAITVRDTAGGELLAPLP